MTDNEIIKTLDCCGKDSSYCVNGDKCPLYKNHFCREELKEKALDLINRQQAEIESLEKKIQHLFEEGLGDKAYLCEIIRVDTMVQTLKWLQEHNYITVSPEERQNIVKEMVGEE